MTLEPVSMAVITSAVTLLGNEYMKGVASEAGKATWTAIKSLFGWASDPSPADIPEKVAAALTTSPEIADELLNILKTMNAGTPSAMVERIDAQGGKIIVANTIITDHFQM